MSLLQEFHEAHKARLRRLGVIAPARRRIAPPVRVSVAPPVEATPDTIAPVVPLEGEKGHSTEEAKVIPNLPTTPAIPRVQVIQWVVCQFFGISIFDLLSERRAARFVFPRHVAMYLAKNLTLKSYPWLGRRFGGRDHTTILHGCRKIEAALETDSELRNVIEHLRQQVRSATS